MNLKIYLDVNFAEKDEVKALGAHWDYVQKRWYIFQGQWTSDFEKWVSNIQVPVKKDKRAEILMD